ncbi:MAG: hypothetical protein Q7T55_23440 [Solirubrobacteraceae bacterium]|nr:hypothetical protein [Solirubrobacteraceae bacterium]
MAVQAISIIDRRRGGRAAPAAAPDPTRAARAVAPASASPERFTRISERAAAAAVEAFFAADERPGARPQVPCASSQASQVVR